MGRKSKIEDNGQDRDYVVATRVAKEVKTFIVNMSKTHDLHQSQCLRRMIDFYIDYKTMENNNCDD